MTDIAICTVCGKEKGLCESVRMNGIKQPRVCKDCLIESLRNAVDCKINDIYWFRQIVQLDDQETIKNLRKQDGNELD